MTQRECVTWGKLIRVRLAASIIDSINYISPRIRSMERPILFCQGSMNVYNETERIKYIFGHIKSKDKQMKIINKGYHELYIDREKDTFFNILRRWLTEKLSVVVVRTVPVGPAKFQSDYKNKKPLVKVRILVTVGVYLLVTLA